MKVLKQINNNFVLCLDSNNNELVAFGKGIGFGKLPYDVELDRISRTYYGIDESYIGMINDIPEEMIELAANVIDYARMKTDRLTNSNVIFTLADHINFAVRRYRENMNIRLPILYDIRNLFETEMIIGEKALELIESRLGVRMPEDEAAYIALHILNAESMSRTAEKTKQDEEVIQEITEIVERYFCIHIDRQDFNYSRFVTHMYYLLKRGKNNEFLRNDSKAMYLSIIDEIPQTYECYRLIRAYLKNTLQWELTDEEDMYLLMHVHRLCAREDCNQ